MENRMDCKNTAFSSTHRVHCQRGILKIDRPLVMGILNLTPDSFYDGGFYRKIPEILQRVEQMIGHGADIIDLGAVSTRPGSAEVPPEEEEQRLLPVIDIIRKRFNDILLSVDTYRSVVAQKAIDRGADLINDISAGRFDLDMIRTISQLKVPFIMMHIQGQPANMQLNPIYENVVNEVHLFFEERIEAMSREGIDDLILDPGFGFGKTVRHNYELLSNLEHFMTFNKPVMVGLSRKSMINRVLETQPSEALNGTTVLNTIAVLKGAHILRVHDVREAVEVVKLCREYISNPV